MTKADICAAIRRIDIALSDYICHGDFPIGGWVGDIRMLRDFAAQHAEPAPAERIDPSTMTIGPGPDGPPGYRVNPLAAQLAMPSKPAPADTPELVEIVIVALNNGEIPVDKPYWRELLSDRAKAILSALSAAGAIAGPGQVVVPLDTGDDGEPLCAFYEVSGVHWKVTVECTGRRYD